MNHANRARPPRYRSKWHWVAGVLIVFMALTTIGMMIHVYLSNSGRTNYTPPTYANPYSQSGLNSPPLAADELAIVAPFEDQQEVREFLKRFCHDLPKSNEQQEKYFERNSLQAATSWIFGTIDPLSEFELEIPKNPKLPSAAETVISQATEEWQNWLPQQMVVRAISFSPSSGTLFAVTSHVRKDGTRDRMLWTISRTAGGLRIVDWEDLSCGFTGRLHVAIEYLLNNETGIVRAHDYGIFLRLRDATRNMRQQQFAGNEYVLNQAARLQPQGEFADFLSVCEALFHLKAGTPYNAAVILDALVKREEHPRSAELIRARAGVACENAKVSLQICNAVRTIFGNDSDLLFTEALVHEQLGDRELAEQKFQAALREDPSHFDALKAYLAFLPPGKKEPFEKIFSALPKPEMVFDVFARELEQIKDWAALLHFAEVFQKLKPQDDRPFRYLIAAHVELNKPDAAIAVYRTAFAKLTGWKRNSLRSMFYNRMALKYPEKAYASAITNDERTFAFQLLTRNLMAERDDDTKVAPEIPILKSIVAQHKKAVPNDRLIVQVEGEWAFMEKRYEEAEKLLDAIVEKFKKPVINSDDDDEYDKNYAIRAIWLRTKARLGKASDAYTEMSEWPEASAFAILTAELDKAENGDGLIDLAKIHGKNNGAEYDVNYWTAQGNWHKKEYAEAAKGFHKYLDAASDDDYSYSRIKVAEERLIRSHIRSRNAIAAWKYLEAHPLPPLLKVVAAAAEGKHDAAIRFMRDGLKNLTLQIAPLYADPDLGPILKKAEYDVFREDFPEPPPPGDE